MTITLIFFAALLLEQCMGQVIDIGGIWEIKCPQGCFCEIQKFGDLSLHQWSDPNRDKEEDLIYDGTDFHFYDDHPLASELLKVATCVIVDNPEGILAKLPSDIQVLTILESDGGQSEILLGGTSFQRFSQLISLDLQGVNYNELFTKDTINDRKKKNGILLSVDALIPLGISLLYLNLERVTLTNLNPMNKNKANLVVKPAQNDREIDENQAAVMNASQHKGHRLIFLSQQNSGESDDKEILPYDIYKQEMEGYRDTAGLFTALGALTHLRVYNCALKDVSWHMFDGLNSLLYLSLEKNNLKFIPEFCFYGTPNLKLLSLAGNQLLTLKSVDLAGLLMLENLDLKGNNLTFLSELSFPPFPALRFADFRDNPLDSIFPSTFEIMNTTEKLFLGGSESRLRLQKNSLLGLRQLQILHVHNLEVRVLERFVLQGMPALLELKIQGNISSIDFDAFVDLNNLSDLDLSYCHIRQISMDAFYGLEKVKRIDLSNNEIESIPPGLFSVQQQKELREIILTNNRLTSLPLEFFKNLRMPNMQPQVQSVRLDRNPWDCTCAMMSWNPRLVNRVRETAPRCFTPDRLNNWGVFHALRKGGLQCKAPKRKHSRQSLRSRKYIEDNSISS
ncbi:hypothetical protein KM043_014531 [Ampulex compressa]|nr:hypothetical protein KM043_014531 [Ampulex compressa]